MKNDQPAQESLQLATPDTGVTNVEKYEFEPIKGYPMLNWRGKRPFTSTQYYPAQIKEIHGEEVDGWRNKIFWGDNLQVMSHLLKQFRGKVDLIYIDPPFDSRADYKKKIEIGGNRATSSASSFEEKQYGDIWTNDEYLQFMYERLALMRELLAETGTIYVHCDSKKGHHLRCLLDELFGADNFVNEVTWHYYNKMAPDSKCFPRASDKILAFSKRMGNHTFHKQVEERDKPVKQLVRKFVDGKAINARDEDGNVMYRETNEKRVDDVWRLSMLQPADKTENTGYPTQKPETLVERIISASSNPGDLVFDCFMGAGTTQAVSMRLGRRFIGADINLGAIQTTTKRLIRGASELKQGVLGESGQVFTGFELYTVNHYDIFRNPVQAKELLIEALEVQKLEFSSVFDGEKDGRMVKIMPVNRIATRADLNELIAGFDYKAWERKQNEGPNRPVEKITLVCMGHEPDLAAQLELAAKPFKIDVEVVDILRDKADLEFKRDSQAKVVIKGGELVIQMFYPMNLLQKLSLQKEAVDDWKELVESVLIDWNYDGAVLQPAVVDIPSKSDLVKGVYKVPEDAGTIRVKITDLLSESWEGSISNGDYADAADLYNFDQPEEEGELTTNQRFEKLCRLEQLGIYVDEAHHAFGKALAKDMGVGAKETDTSLRTTIDELAGKLNAAGTRVVACYNYTGTPYVGREVLPEVVYAYGLKESIDKGFLKKVTLHGYANTRTDEFVDIAIESFLKETDGLRPEGLSPKLAFFAATIDELTGDLKPAVERALLKHGIPTSRILVNVGDDKLTTNDDIREFNRLDTEGSEKQFILLVNKGREGWNCRSLFGVGLFREPKSKVFVLQATMRCLRAIGQAQHTGHVFLSDDNLNTLNNELQQNFRISADELQKTASDKERVEIRVVEPPVKIKLVRVRKQYEMREKKLTPGQALGLDRTEREAWSTLVEKYRLIETQQDGLTAADAVRASSSRTFDLTTRRVKRVFSRMTLVAEVSRYLNRSPMEIEDGSLKYVIVEVKADNQIEDAVVQAKKDFAQQIAVASGMEYQIIKSTDADNRHYRVLL